MREMYKDIDFRKNVRTYLKLIGKYKWAFTFIVIVSIIVEGIRVLEKFLFKIILDRGAEFVAGTLLRAVFVSILITIGLVYVFSNIFKIVISNWLETKIYQRIIANLHLDIKQKFFNHIVQLDHNFHTTHKTGSLISRLNRGVGASDMLTDFILNSIIPLVVQLVIITISLLLLDPTSAIVIVCTSVLFVIWGVFNAKRRKHTHIEYNKADDNEKGTLGDVFTNIDSVKYYGKERYVGKRYANLTENTKKKLIAFSHFSLVNGIGNGIIVFVGTFFLLFFPIVGFLNGTVTIGTLSFIYTSYLGILAPLYSFVGGIRNYYKSIGDFDTLFKYQEIENEIKDADNAREFDPGNAEIEFNNISFSYPGRGDGAINNLNLKINKSEKVALVGHSGSGKTTLVKLLYRLYNLDNGEIKIDGENINEFEQESLRSGLSIVPQECILFDDSIYNNILFSNPKASRAEVMRAMKFAQLDKFVEKLPKKENTIVGERGIKLSGGEKQRVSIARAILANKKILVLDEATSALDSKTEFEIQQDLERLMQGRTSIIIAHRLSTIMKADKIVVMDKGRVVQIGKHRDLIRQGGIYRELWNLQKGGYIKE